MNRWMAIVTDADGFVLDEYMLYRWISATKAGATGWAVPCEPPTAVRVATGTAMPSPQYEGSDTYRAPGSYMTSDLLFEIDVEDEDPDTILLTWERASACADGLNERNIS